MDSLVPPGPLPTPVNETSYSGYFEITSLKYFVLENLSNEKWSFSLVCPVLELLPRPLKLVVVVPEGALEVLRREEDVELDVGRRDHGHLGADEAEHHGGKGR